MAPAKRERERERELCTFPQTSPGLGGETLESIFFP